MKLKSISNAYQGHFWLLIGFGIILLGAAVRLYYIDGDSFWFDEILTVYTAREGISGAWAVPYHPPLLYTSVSISRALFGDNAFAARLPSALAAILSVPLLLQWGRALGRPSVAAWAGFLLALSPFHLRYAQEARHYALLLCFSLLALTALTLAWRRRQWRWWLLWAAATALSLYTHYAALLVLATELLLIGGLTLLRWRRHGRSILPHLHRPFLAILLIPLLSLPLAPQLWRSLGHNLSGTSDPSRAAGLLTWLREAGIAFGFKQGVLPLATAVLVLLGLLLWARRRNWAPLLLVLSLMATPLLLIALFQVDRWALPKYVIFILPAYLLAAAAGWDALVRWLGAAVSAPRLVAIAAALLLLATLSFPLRAEYAFTRRDWRGALAFLGDQAAPGDYILTLALDTPDGFNAAGVVTPYYLDRHLARYTILDGDRLTLEQAERLTGESGAVWVVALHIHRASLTFADPAVQVHTFPDRLSIIHNPKAAGQPIVPQLLDLYAQLQPLALAPSPQCLMGEGMAALHTARRDYPAAQAALTEARRQCPPRASARPILQGTIDHGMLDHYQATGQKEAAVALAHQLLQRNPNDREALQAITLVDLLDRFAGGEAQVVDTAVPEPIEIRSFTMPQNGDQDQVIFAHPPAAVSFPLTLPAEETAVFRARLATAPPSWAWGGDGVSFVVTVETNQTRQTLLRRHISNDPADRRWHLVEHSLAPFAGQSITLTLSTETGPAGDGTGDWAGWGSPRIVHGIQNQFSKR